MTQNPCIILVHPQMGENIGAAARAMLNFGLSDLRLVAPRDGWPSPKAQAMSSGALDKMPEVKVFDTTAQAIADCHYVFATTARKRDMSKPLFSPQKATEEALKKEKAGQMTAFLFGAERAGLSNDDIALSHGIIHIPVNPDFASLNLGQSVLLIAYEYLKQKRDVPDQTHHLEENEPADRKTMIELFERFENALEETHFFRNEGQKPIMIRNLRNMLSRAEMSDQEARTFHGIISAFIGKKEPPQN